MKKFILLLILITTFTLPASAQTVDSNMIELSYDGITFTDATAFISDIEIIVGAVTAPHVSHARRGTIIKWEGQLGTPHSDKKVTYLLDTLKLPVSENKFHMRFKFSVGLLGQRIESPFSVKSDVVKLIGRPGKPVNTG